MHKYTLLCLLVSLTTNAFGQVQAIPGTLNQIKKDPAQSGFEREYDDLQHTIDDLDEPVENQNEEEREEELPSHKVKTDYDKKNSN